mgnify:CR=1 FL=1
MIVHLQEEDVVIPADAHVEWHVALMQNRAIVLDAARCKTLAECVQAALVLIFVVRIQPLLFKNQPL